MNYEKLGEDIHIPKLEERPLKNRDDIKFNYYLSSRVNGKNIDLDITSKIFDNDQIYIRKSCYRVKLGQIENCVKSNIIEHMKELGIPQTRIPESLKNIKRTKPKAYSDSTV